MSILWSILTGGGIPVLLAVSALFFFAYLRGLPFVRPRAMLGALTEKQPGGVSPFRALTLSLAGTLGVGNIVGVANALAIGGAGALFWMWLSALLAMILKYAEILLAVRFRQTLPDGSHTGGAVYYIRHAFGPSARAGGFFALLFAMFMILNSFTMGCVIQVNAVSSAFSGVLKIPVWITAASLVLLTTPVILRGAKGISALTEYLVPVMSLGFVVLSVTVLILRREAVPAVLSSVFREAFSPASAAGGILGFLTCRALRVGTMRGLLSNEAGCGTAPTAHAGANTTSPAAQGVWGIVEVFVDTILLCSLTAFVILVNFPAAKEYAETPVMMTVAAFAASLGSGAGWFLSAAIFCFGYATVICWAEYGASALWSIKKSSRLRTAYLLTFLFCIPIGCAVAPNAIWSISDFAITVLTSINLLVLFLLRRKIREETEKRFGKVQKRHRTTKTNSPESGGVQFLPRGKKRPTRNLTQEKHTATRTRQAEKSSR